jgi:hypothetical protein
MVADPHLVERSGALKRELFDYVQSRRFERVLRKALDRRFDPVMPIEESALIEFMDSFILQERLRDGRTIVEHFVAEHPELPEDERAMLLGWHDPVEGLCEVKQRDGDAVLLFNLVDEMTYRVHSNMGPAMLRQLRRGTFITTRLVPVGDDWVLSGIATLAPPVSRAEMYQAAADLALRFPALVFRNPEKLARGWELQREERERFIDYFGSDLVVLPGRELKRRMAAFMHYRSFEARDADGQTIADKYREAYGAEPPHVEHPWDHDLLAAESVGVVYDEIDGLNYTIDFGLVAAAFADPALLSSRKHRQAVIEYLESATISPRLLRRLAEEDPARASQVFAQILKRPKFTWEKDGEALLRRYKASYFKHPVLPSVAPMSSTLTEARAAGQKGERPSRPRKIGSWRRGGRPR